MKNRTPAARLFTIPPGAEGDPANQHLRRNFLTNVLHQVTLFFGDSFVAYQTILPVFAATLTTSPVLIGLVPAIYEAGWFLPQLFFAPVVERLPRRKPLVLWLGMLERLAYLFLALTTFFLHRFEGSIPIILFLTLITWKSLVGGLAGLPWQDFVAKVFPVWLRGRFFGVSHFGGKLLGLGAASLTGLILARLAYPYNYALIFLLGFIFLFLSLGFFILTVEPDTPLTVQPGEGTGFAAQIGDILRTDADFRLYLLSRGLSYMGGMAVAFVALFAIQRYQLTDAYAAVFTSIVFAFSAAGLLGWGGLNDRFGSKFVLIGSAALWAGALVVLLLWRSLPAVYLAFALAGLSQPGNIIGDLNMPMDFAKGPRRPTYIGMARTLTSPVLLVAPLLAGLVVQWAGYIWMFAVSLAFALGGLGLLVLGVNDPRRPR